MMSAIFVYMTFCSQCGMHVLVYIICTLNNDICYGYITL